MPFVTIVSFQGMLINVHPFALVDLVKEITKREHQGYSFFN